MRSQVLVEEVPKMVATSGGGFVVFKMTLVEFGAVFASMATGFYFLLAGLHTLWKWRKEAKALKNGEQSAH